jgi:hypothetical protein
MEVKQTGIATKHISTVTNNDKVHREMCVTVYKHRSKTPIPVIYTSGRVQCKENFYTTAKYKLNQSEPNLSGLYHRSIFLRSNYLIRKSSHTDNMNSAIHYLDQ